MAGARVLEVDDVVDCLVSTNVVAVAVDMLMYAPGVTVQEIYKGYLITGKKQA